MKDIGKRIKELREVESLSQSKLAEILKIKQNTVSQYENGVRQPSYEILILIADFFEVTTDYLLGRTDY